jgi:hypothetical protein
MSDTLIIANKLKRLVNHLKNGGSEEDAERILKVRDKDHIEEYLTKARAEISGDVAPAPEEKTAKPKAAKSEVKETSLDDEEEDDDLDDDDLEDDEDWDASPVEVEEAVEAKPAPEPEPAPEAKPKPKAAPAPEPKPAAAPEPKPAAPAPAAQSSDKKFFLLDASGVRQPLTLVNDRGDRAIFKVYQDTPVKIKVGTAEVEVMKDKVLSHEGAAITLPNGGTYPTEFVKAAVQLATL